MVTETQSKEQQWKDPIYSSSSSQSSSITSDSSDGHFDIRHFPLPKPSLSASEVQKQRESHQAYIGSSLSSIHKNHLVDIPGYDSNRIPSSIFSSKPVNSTEWSIASNESLFSIHDGNFSISKREDHGLAAALRLGEISRFEETVHEITEIDPVPLPRVNNPTESEKTTITEKILDQVEYSDSEIDDNEEEDMIELKINVEHEEEEEEEEDMIEAEVLVGIETEKQEEKEVVEDVKENKQEDSNSTVSNSLSISCRSDTSNSSFAFPVMQKEDGVNKKPSIEIRGNVSNERKPEYLLPLSPMQPPQPQPQPQQQPYSESSTPSQWLPQSQLQRKTSKQFKSRTQSPKASRNGWFSCFHCPSKRGLFK